MNNSVYLPGKRIEIADVLRGFAIMGIFLLHCIEHFNFYSYPDTTTQGSFFNFTDKAIWDGLFFTLGGKCYAIFALLFGFSFFVQDSSRLAKGKDFRLRFLWRLVLLLLLGFFNAAFFTAEVLVLYALTGVILPLTCRLSDRTVLWIAVVFLLQPVELFRLGAEIVSPGWLAEGADRTGEYFSAAFEAQANGTFFQTMKVNLWEGQLASLHWAWHHGRVLQTAGLFLLGMLIGRRKIFLNSEANTRLWLKVLIVSTASFFLFFGLNNLLRQFLSAGQVKTSINLILSSWYNFCFMLMLVSSVISLYYNSRTKKTLSLLIPYGRMSLTNYITQSVIGSAIFYNWGLGLHDRLGITCSFLLGILLFLLQYLFCRWWLSNFSQGPFEWAWKKATWIGADKK